MKGGNVVSYSSSFNGSQRLIHRPNLFITPRLSKQERIRRVENTLGLTLHDLQVPRLLLADSNGVLKEAIRAEFRGSSKRVLAYISLSGEVLDSVDLLSEAKYRVIYFRHLDPTNGGFQIIKNPEYFASSPKGWLNDTMLQGNNVRVFHVNQDGEKRLVRISANSSDFSLWWNENLDPKSEVNILAVATNAFYSKHFSPYQAFTFC
jgi:hypothetical protein